jgi:D-alanine transaminase
MGSIAYLDGRYLPRQDARISVDDRGFLFGDGVYEVVRVRDAVFIEMDRHLSRMARGLGALSLAFDPAPFREISDRLVEDNDLRRGEALVYWQVTRGAADSRTHQFPPPGTPVTVYASATAFAPPEAQRTQGVRAILVPDQRWSRCDLKTINLLPNVMAKQRAIAAGVWEAIQVRDGAVTEGASTNVFGVLDGVLRTYPRSPYILPGVTRDVVVELATAIGLAVREEPLFVDDLPWLSECFLTGTTNDVMPVTEIDGHRVGLGRPGPIAARLYGALMARWREQEPSAAAAPGAGE